ncbi:MAG: MFS transporter [Actinomycetota bacterium]
MQTPPFVAVRRLAVARCISVAGSMAAYTALIDLVYRRTHGSTVYLSATILLTIGAVGLLEPVGGAVADRFDRKRVLIWSDLVSAALFVVLALVHAPWQLLTVALMTAVAETPFRAGSVAAVPNLVGDDELIARANGWIGVGSNLGIMLGPALGGVLVGWIGAGPVFVLNAASFVLSAALVWSIHARFTGETAQTHDEGSFAAGFRFLRRDRVLLVVTLSWMVLLLGMGLGIVSDRPVAAHFDAGAVGFGVMLGLFGLGSVVGSWAASRIGAEQEPPALVLGFVLAGISGIAIALAPAFAIVLAANVTWGFGDAVTVVAEQGIIQRRTPDAVRSRVVAANEALVHAALMVGIVLAGPAIAWVGPQVTYGIGGVAALAAGGLATTILTTARPRQGERPSLAREPPINPLD